MENNIRKELSLYGEYNGDLVGVEIEMETVDPVYDWGPVHKDWNTEIDHSLKDNGMELVLKKPSVEKKVLETLSALKKNLLKSGAQIKPSVRAGVHVHINMQDNTLSDLKKFIACYYAFETVITKNCGEGRESNLFCLRLEDSEFLGLKLHKFFKEGKINYLSTENLRYSALNFQSLFSFGTIELRSRATPEDLEDIKGWVSFLLQLKRYSLTLDEPSDVYEKCFSNGPRAWMEEVFGEHFEQYDYEKAPMDISESLNRCQIFLKVGTE